MRDAVDCFDREVRFFFFSSRRRHTRLQGDWSSDVCSSDLLIGMRAAVHLILTGNQIGAAEACRLGLATRVVPDGELPRAVDNLLAQLRALSPAVLRLTRRTLTRVHAEGFREQLQDVERVYLSELIETEDAQEGIREIGRAWCRERV